VTSKQRDKDSQVPEQFELCHFESTVAWSSSVAVQRRKPAAIGVKAPFPGFIEPALATSIEKVPSGERWIHEIKFDGYRVQVHLANEAAKIFTGAAMIGRIALRRLRMTPGGSRRTRP
jgi:bifunctional non-homologous end joining protein LigD